MSGHRRKRSVAGETIVESLVSTLIVVLVSIFLANAVITAARVNSMVKDADYSYDVSTAMKSDTVEVMVAGKNVKADVYKVEANNADAEYYYYEE